MNGLSGKSIDSYRYIHSKMEKTYDGTAWEKVGDMPSTTYRDNCVSINNKIYRYSVGNVFSSTDIISGISYWDEETSKWVMTGATGGFAHHGGGNTVDTDNNIGYFMGSDGTAYPTLAAVFQSYDPETNKLTSLTNIDCYAAGCSLVYYKNYLYRLGGHNGSTLNSSRYFYKYSIADGTWTSMMKTSIPIAFSYGAATIYHDKIHIFINSDHYYFDLEALVWTKDSSLPFTMSFGACCVHRDKICLTTSNKFYTWDEVNGYTLIGTIAGTNNASLISNNDRLYNLGGDNASYFYRLSTEKRNVITLPYDKNTNIYYSDSVSGINYTESHIELYYDVNSDEPAIYAYNKFDSILLYTNQSISYNLKTSKYEIYGYFPITLKNCNATITETGWQTLQLDTPSLFTN